MRYKFRYFNRMYKTVASIVGPFQNFFLIWALSLLLFFLLGKLSIFIGLENYLINDTVWGILQKIILTCSILWAAVYCIFRKGVYLYDDHLVIARYTFTLTNWKNRITVNYDEIESVNINYSDLHFTKYRFSMLVLCGDEAYNVELTLKTGKKYYFSIEDQVEFCENLNLRIKNRKQSQI